MKNMLSKILSALTLLATFSCAGPAAFASQNATTLPTASPYPGLTMINNINSAFDTLQTNFSGASAPSSPKTYQYWVDSSNGLLKFYDGTNWLTFGKYGSSQISLVSNGVPLTIPSSTGSSNAYVVTYAPAPTALVVGQHYPFIANFGNTTTATEAVNGLTAHALTKRGATALASGDITNGIVVDDVWDGTEFAIVSQLSNAASGTVTTIATTGGLCGGTITSSGTLSICSASANTVVGNFTGSPGSPTVNNAMPSCTDTGGNHLNYTSGIGLSCGTSGSAGISYSVFTSNGTWNKPANVTSNSQTLIQCWGGGGGGGGNCGGVGAGGGGGAFVERLIQTSSLSSTVSVTIGAGGTGGNGSDGGVGGNSTFGSFLTAYGGGGGSCSSFGGGGGGALSVGTTAGSGTGGSPAGGITSGTRQVDSSNGGGGGGSSSGTAGGNSFMGGAGGGGGGSFNGPGGNSLWGGGGGAGTSGAGGASSYGGAGGAGATAGTTPGGGGGGNSSSVAAGGAPGTCIATVWP